MTVNALALELMAEMDEATDNSDFVTVVETWIKDALSEIGSAHDWRIFKRTDTLAITTGVRIYDLDNEVRDIRAMRFVDTNEPIEYVDAQRLIGIAEDFERTGKPQFWFWYDALGTLSNPKLEIQIVPTPDGDYTVQMQTVIFPLGLTTSSEIPVQAELILAIKDRVRAYIYSSDKDYDGADRCLNVFYQRVERMIEREKAPKAANMRMQVRDLSNASDRKLARLDPSHFS